MSTREDQIKRILAKTSVDAAVSNDPVSGTVTPPSTPIPPSATVGGVNQPSSADQSGQGVKGYLTQAARDVVPAIKRGVTSAVNETAKTIDEFGTWAGDKVHDAIGPAPDLIDSHGFPYNSTNWMVPGPQRAKLAEDQKAQEGQPLIPDNATVPFFDININPPAPKTVVGKTIEGITNFATGLAIGGRLTKGLTVFNEAGEAVAAGGKLGALGLNALNGGIATFIASDPRARNLFNLIGDNYPVASALTGYLAANPNDNAVEARLRNAANGMALGAATDVLLASAKFIKLDRLWKNAPAAAKPAANTARDKALSELDEIIAKRKATTQAPTPGATRPPTAIQRFQAVKNEDGTGAVIDTRSARGEAAKTILGPDGKPQSVPAGDRPGYKPRSVIERRKKTVTDEDLAAQGTTVTTDAAGKKTYSRVGPDGKPQEVQIAGNPDRRAVQSERRQGQKIQDSSNTPNNTEYHPTFEEAQAAADTKNMIEQDKVMSLTRPSTVITPEQAATMHAQVKDLVSPDNPWMSQTDGIDFNLGRVDTDENAKAAVEAVGQVLRPEMDAARGTAELTNEQLKAGVADLFNETGQDFEKTFQEIMRPDSNPNDLPIRLNAGRLVMDKISSEVIKYSSLLEDSPEDPALLNILAKHMGNLVRVAQVTKGRITSAARATQSGNITTGELGRAVEDAAKSGAGPRGTAVMGEADILAHKLAIAIPNMTTEQLQAFARKVQLTNGDPGTLLSMLGVFKHATDDALKKPGFMDKVNFAWVSSILSGPLTTAKNFTGNVFGLGAAPAERYLTGTIMKAGGIEGGAAVQQEGADLFAGFFTNMRDSFKAAKTAFMTNKPILEQGNLTNEIQNPFQGYLGTAVGVPSRFLMSQDEFFKNLAYRSYVRSKALSEAAQKGMTSADTAELVAQRMDESLVNGIALNNNAMAFAQKATYTSPLTPGSFGDTLAGAAAKHPALRFAALPFVKTPTNLLLWTWDRTPGIALISKSNREALAAGGERAAEVMSRQATGSLIWGAGVLATLSGTITSGGPKDPVQRKLWEDTGWKPYSIKMGEDKDGRPRYVPYMPADPVLMPWGIIADAVQASREMDENHQSNFAMAFTAAMGRNVASKSYMYAATDAADALMSGDTNKLDKWFKSRTGSFVPALFRQTNPDDTMREMRDYTDQVLGNLPGFSETLAPKVSFFGRPIMKAPFSSGRALNPFTPAYGQADTSVEDKLMVLGRDFSYPSKNYPGTQIDMTTRDYGLAQGNLTPYDRMLQIMANPGGGMPSLRTTLSKLTNSPAWDKMSPGVPGIQQGGTRFDEVNQQVQKYRGLAMKRILQEFPAMQDAINTSKITKKVAEKGGQPALDKLKGFLNDPQH